MPLCYGGVHAQRQLLTPSLFHSLTYVQRWLSTWYCKQDTAGTEHFFFHHQPAWLYCPGSIGLQFLVAACTSEQWWEVSFGTLLSHIHCPLCGAAIGNVDDIWEHLLCLCSGSECVAEN